MGYDVIIAGAGIVGAACAAELSAAGLAVALVEPDMVGGGATAAGMGHIAVMDDSPAQFALTRYSQLLWKELAGQLPDDVEYVACGSLWIAADDLEMAEVRRKFEYYRECAVPVEILDRRALAEAEPNLRPGMAGALLMRDDAVLYAPAAARFLVRRARVDGMDYYPGASVQHVDEGVVLLSDGTRMFSRWIILANGTAASRLVPDLAMQPRKGHLLITDRYPEFVRHQLIELGYLKSAHSVAGDSVAFNVQPRRTGQLLIGSSRQYGAPDGAVEAAMLAKMIARAVEYMPGLGRLQAIRSWAGFRAATPDKLPLIGRHSGFRSVYLATGHEGLGISTSLATANLLADMLLGRISKVPLEPYSPGRTFQHACGSDDYHAVSQLPYFNRAPFSGRP